MNKNGCTIRNEKIDDHRKVEELVRESFWNVYKPGCDEHYLIHVLREYEDVIPELNLVLEKDGEIIGQIIFVRSVVKADDGRDVPVTTMGPICIHPKYKRQGYGKFLLDHALERAAELGYGAVCIEGNINFYGKSGFVAAHTKGLRYHDMPEGEVASFFLCRELQEGYLDGVTGVYGPPQVYFVDSREVEEFDKSFPPKEKLKLPGQIFG